MQLTEQQTAHILAALRHCQGKDLRGMPHFDVTIPLSDAEVDALCERLNLAENTEPDDSERKGGLQSYTVVGLFPDSDWDSSMRDASFVLFVHAATPNSATASARLQAAQKRAEEWDEQDAETLQEEIADFASRSEVLAVLEGHLPDLYDPQGDAAASVQK